MQSHSSRKRRAANQRSQRDARQPPLSTCVALPSSQDSPEHDELLESSVVWHQHTNTNTTLTNNPPIRKTSSPLHPNIFRPPPLDTNSFEDLTDIDQHEAASSDASDFDFELIDPPPPSQIDGPAEGESGEYRYISSILRPAPIRQSTGRYIFPSQALAARNPDWNAVSGTQPTMDNENDYANPEWQQAGPNADAQDLAGPGDHGVLECTVSKPQKEGEGTQNVYTSYLVTTDVCITPSSYRHPY